MTKYAVVGCVWLAACEPVLLEGDATEPRSTDHHHTPSGAAGFPNASDDVLATGGHGEPGSTMESSAGTAGSNVAPEIQLIIKSSDCGACFELLAQGTGGVPPYRYLWEDRSTSPSRQVCVGTSGQKVSVFAEDQDGVRSRPREADLQTLDSEGCSAGQTQSGVCLRNLSFEGTATINTGGLFDATPWSDCVDVANAGVANTPDIASNTLDPVTGIAPPPRDGDTYLAMTNGEQASQQLCAALVAQTEGSLRLDAMRFDLGGPDTYLQVWGGQSASCSQRQLLWVSPALSTTWESHCITLRFSEFTDLLTFRAIAADPNTMFPSYIAVDNLVPVDRCP
jgi:hypothetical protein